MGGGVGQFSTEYDPLKKKTGSYDEKWLEESKAKLLKQIDDEKKEEIIYV